MADYTVDPADATEPVDTKKARWGAEELRALKNRINTLVVAAGKSTGVRQTVLAASVDADGYSNALAAGTGLALNLNATTAAILMAFAIGFDPSLGEANQYSQLSASANDIVTALHASNTNYISADYVGINSVTWNKHLIPPQYGNAFDKTQNINMNFEGADASTSMIDAFGNTWTAVANAQIDTAQFKFGASSLLLDGTGDYVESTNFTSLGDGSWEICCWFRANSLGGTHAAVFSAENAAGYGFPVCVDTNAGSPRISTYISGNGTSNDILTTTRGTTVLVVNTWYRVRAVFDALAGTYRIYLSNNGAAETQEITTSSTSRVCAITRIRLGRNAQAGTSDYNGWIDAVTFKRCASVTGTETPAVVAPTVTDHLVHFFSIPEMKMYEVTSASLVAGTNPTLTQRTRLFLGEADTSGVAVTAVRNYAIRGEYVSPLTVIPAATVPQVFTHNLGSIENNIYLDLVNQTAQLGFTPNNRVRMASYGDSATGSISIGTSRNSGFVTWNTGLAIQANGVGGFAAVTTANWRYQLSAKRRW